MALVMFIIKPVAYIKFDSGISDKPVKSIFPVILIELILILLPHYAIIN